MTIAAAPKSNEPADPHGGVSRGTVNLSNIPDTLIRILGGRITSWPAGMERRYGFTREQAVGRILHELLNTLFPHPLHEIEATLLACNAWSGGVIHRHASGRTVAAMNVWGLHRAGDGEALVIETHSSPASLELADLLAIFANEFSQPLTAIGNYLSGARRTLKHRRADQQIAHEAMALADIQVMRGADQVRLLRRVASDLRLNG